MTMGDETPVTTLILPVLIRPILSELEKQDVSASQTLRSALTKAEASYPGLTYDLVIGILRRGDLTVNMNENLVTGTCLCMREAWRSFILALRLFVVFVATMIIPNAAFEIVVLCMPPTQPIVEYRLNRSEDAFQELNKKSAALKEFSVEYQMK
ncbi:hypothetical protein NQ317_017715 [Molorchus minor]|uniref:Programmed cell death protein 10 dimerisation domain-containing protein n=1 Tax=Molorchus minor TaxID=1323400 RepID=A0ABQ9J5G7_9CUCU|nr:hypothetical protein NQ317_017715 [Molorchus minor]